MQNLTINAGYESVLSAPILQVMKKVHGWLEEQEAELLMCTAIRALDSMVAGAAVVEVGSFCGRSTVVLGSVVKALNARTKVYAVDPHEGVVGAVDQGIELFPPTLAAFRRNISENGLSNVVEAITKCSFEVVWSKAICLLFIDALNDYDNVARDFRHFEPWLQPEAYIAFHNCDKQHPGVQTFVSQLLITPQYQQVDCEGSMMVVRLLQHT